MADDTGAPTLTRFRRLVTTKGELYKTVLLLSVGGLLISMPFANMSPLDSQLRAGFAVVQDLLLWCTANSYRLTIEERSVFILEQANLGIYPRLAVKASYVCVLLRLAFDLCPSDVQV